MSGGSTLLKALSSVAIAAFLAIQGVMNDAPLVVFEPSPGLVEFMENRTDRFILVRAANQIGKTYQGCARLAQVMIEHPGGEYRAIGSSKKQANLVLGKYLAHFLKPHLAPGSYYTPGKGWNNNVIILANGCTCQILSGEDHPQTHAGWAGDGVLIDEVPKQSIFTESLSRVTTKRGFVWVLMTPVDRPVKWFRDIVEAEDSQWVEYTVEYCHANVPWLTKQEVDEHLNNMRSAPWHYEQRVYGAWEGVTLDRFYMGLTDRNFTAIELGDGRWKVGLTFDHGDKAGSEVCILIVYREQAGHGLNRPVQWHCLDEYVSDRATSINEDADAVLAMLREHGISPDEIDLVVGDINVSRSAGEAASKVNEQLERAFADALGRKRSPFRIDDAEKHLGQWGRRLTNQLLRHGDLTVSPDCPELERSLKNWKGKDSGSDGELKHLPDALRYFLTAAAAEHPAYDRLRF